MNRYVQAYIQDVHQILHLDIPLMYTGAGKHGLSIIDVEGYQSHLAFCKSKRQTWLLFTDP